MDSKRDLELTLLGKLKSEQWANEFFNTETDKKHLLNLAKKIGEEFEINLVQDIKDNIRCCLNDMSFDRQNEHFNCKEAGFHLWDFEHPDISKDDDEELEITIECKLCDTEIKLNGFAVVNESSEI